jgi:hypothetical protein
MKQVKIFLASEGGIEDIRDQIELGILRRIPHYRSFGFNDDLVLFRWETHSKRFSGKRKQDEFNRLIKECEIFIAIFFRKANLTKEELLEAYDSYQQGVNPRNILVYFYEPKIDLGSIDANFTKVIKLKKWISSQEQVFTQVDTSSKLLMNILGEIEFLIKDKSQQTGSISASSVTSKEKVKEINEYNNKNKILFLHQLAAQLNIVNQKISNDIILFGYPSTNDITEKARLEFEISRIKVGE